MKDEKEEIKEPYEKPEVQSEEIEIGVYGNYDNFGAFVKPVTLQCV
jgi:hypothetical protein